MNIHANEAVSQIQFVINRCNIAILQLHPQQTRNKTSRSAGRTKAAKREFPINATRGGNGCKITRRERFPRRYIFIRILFKIFIYFKHFDVIKSGVYHICVSSQKRGYFLLKNILKVSVFLLCFCLFAILLALSCKTDVRWRFLVFNILCDEWGQPKRIFLKIANVITLYIIICEQK